MLHLYFQLLTPTPERLRSRLSQSHDTPGLEGVRAALDFESPVNLDDEKPPEDLIEPDLELVSGALNDEFKQLQVIFQLLFCQHSCFFLCFPTVRLLLR